MKNLNKALILGFVAGIFYFTAVVLGGLLWSGYSHVRQPISELTMASAPNQIIIQPLFFLYNFLTLIFAGYLFTKKENIFIKISVSLLFINAVAGLLMIFFPQDPMNSELTFKGLMHLILAGIMAIGSIFSVFMGGIGVNKKYHLRKFFIVSMILGSLVVIFGGMTPAMAANLPEYFGIFERVTIFSFVIWMMYFSRICYKTIDQ